MVPSVEQIGQAIGGVLVMEDWHNFGPDYVKTCYAWFDKFDRNWQGSKEDRFYRMWKYWILAVGGGFAARTRQMWQLVLSKGASPAATRRCAEWAPPRLSWAGSWRRPASS